MQALIICEILLIYNFDLENVCQGHKVEKQDLRHLIANIIFYKSRNRVFSTSSYRFPDIKYIISRNFVT